MPFDDNEAPGFPVFSGMHIHDGVNTWNPWTGVLTTGDIEIGAVEIKDATTDNRAQVSAAGGLEVDAPPVLATPTKPVDNKNVNYTSDAIDCRGYKKMFIYTLDDGAFAGTVIVQGALGDGAAPVTGYQQYGSALTLGRTEIFRDIPPFIKVNVVRTAGAVSVWVQLAR
jgi:hypothetical protein